MRVSSSSLLLSKGTFKSQRISTILRVMTLRSSAIQLITINHPSYQVHITYDIVVVGLYDRKKYGKKEHDD